MYKLISFDMDGTLLDDEKHIGEETLAMINKAAEEGKQIVMCTGRGVAELDDFVEILSNVRYAICTSGGIIWDMHKKESIYSKTMETDTALKVFAIAKTENPVMQILSVENILTRSDLPKLEDYHFEQYRPSYYRSATLVDDVHAFYKRHPWPVEKLNFHHLSPESRARTADRIKNAGLPVEIKTSEYATLEVNPVGVNKGDTLKYLCGILGIPMDEVIAVGDGGNDIDMLKAAGLPIAVANATDEIKKIAAVTVSDNNHDGCAQAIREYLLAQ